MSRYLFGVLSITFILATACERSETVLKIAVTTDVHGMIYPHDLVRREVSDHSLAHIYNYVTEQRELKDTLFLLLDNGDFLQGQPTVYYFNFIDTTSSHLSSRVMNYMGYDAGTVGNHDIEAGPGVYNKVREEFEFPWLAANAIQMSSGEPYFEPYTILHAGRKKIAVFGMITPGIPNWLPKNLWPGMEFRDMVETARKWVPRIIKEEAPDLLVGLFHSGTDASYGGNSESYLNENAVLMVAEQVPGFDVIFAGHDHRVSKQWVINTSGDSVLVVDPGSHARVAGEATITFGKKKKKSIRARNVSMKGYDPSEAFFKQFSADFKAVSAYLDDTITMLNQEIKGIDALFGPSAIMSLIHQVQLDLSGADISFTAPLSLSARLEKGPILVSDMFKLYRFENMLYRMALTGKEIDNFLEYAAGIWFNTMNGPGDHFLLFHENTPGKLANAYYNFSSAAGIIYTIDLTQAPGNRVSITKFSNGAPFVESETYQVAVNSYRGNGGGGHLTSGAGIDREELAGRISWSSDIDLRYYLIEYLSTKETLQVEPVENWTFFPEKWVELASDSDRRFFN